MTDPESVPQWPTNVLFLQLQTGSLRHGAKLLATLRDIVETLTD